MLLEIAILLTGDTWTEDAITELPPLPWKIGTPSPSDRVSDAVIDPNDVDCNAIVSCRWRCASTSAYAACVDDRGP